MKVGVTLPTFTDDADRALEAARRAEALGLDGVFVFDHLWPLGSRDRPALSAFPMLGAVAAVTSGLWLGPLVARVGLVPDAVLVAELVSLGRLAPGRLIAGLGTGDKLSAPENEAYGIATGSADERRRALVACARPLLARAIPVWVGGGSAATTEVAVALGPGAAINLWEASPVAVAALTGRTEVTWGGPMVGGVPAIARALSALAEAGATWAVCAWPPSLEAVADAAAMVRQSCL
jgi:alkanesulfonate monooxygenase SsuD/methylene tetrahydromethanopterin reductase-like flavin-dependent oxidoreductase (luciferase family)